MARPPLSSWPAPAQPPRSSPDGRPSFGQCQSQALTQERTRRRVSPARSTEKPLPLRTSEPCGLCLCFSEEAGGPGASHSGPGQGAFLYKEPSKSPLASVHPVPSTKAALLRQQLGPGQVAEPRQAGGEVAQEPDAAGHGVPLPPGSSRGQRRQQAPLPWGIGTWLGGGGRGRHRRERVSLA